MPTGLLAIALEFPGNEFQTTNQIAPTKNEGRGISEIKHFKLINDRRIKYF